MILVAAVCLVGATACSSEDMTEGVINRAIDLDGGEGRIDLDGDSITLTDGDSTVSMGSGDLPDGYPQNFPLFDPSVEPVVAMAFNDQEQGEQRMTASYTFEAPAAEVAEWYEAALAAAGYEITEAYRDVAPVVSFEGNGWTGGVSLYEQGTQTQVNVNLERPLE